MYLKSYYYYYYYYYCYYYCYYYYYYYFYYYYYYYCYYYYYYYYYYQPVGRWLVVVWLVLLISSVPTPSTNDASLWTNCAQFRFDDA